MFGVKMGLRPDVQARLVLGFALALIGAGIVGPDGVAVALGIASELTTWNSSPAVCCWTVTGAFLVILFSGCPYHVAGSIDPRGEMSNRFPGWMQRPITVGTGKAPRGGKPLWKKTWKFHLAWPLAWLFAGISISGVMTLLVYCQPLVFVVFLPLTTAGFWVGWILVVGAARHIQVNCVHQIVHNRFSGCPELDRWIGHLAGSLLILQDLDAYFRDHIKVHHQFKYIGTRMDPDAKFLLQLGFRPGMSRRQAWKHFCKLCLSPVRFHGVFLIARLKSNCSDEQTSWKRRLMFVLAQGSILLAVAWSCAALSSALPGLVWLLAWAFPLTLLYQVSAFAQFCGEHFWRLNEGPRDTANFKGRKKAIIAKLTNGRFFGDALPPKNLAGLVWLQAWTYWWLRFVLLHLSARCGVMPGPLTCHDWHHRNETDERWPDSTYGRQEDIDSGADWGEPYTETWGLASSLNTVFDSLSLLEEPERESPAPDMLGM